MSHSLVRKTTLLIVFALVLANSLGVGPSSRVWAEAPIPEVRAAALADSDISIADVQATAIEGDQAGFLVMWQTASPAKGWIEYGTGLDSLDQVGYDRRGEDAADTQHEVTVKDLEPGTVYYYVIVSGGKRYDNAGSLFKVVTAGSIQGQGSSATLAASLGVARPTGIAQAQVRDTEFTVVWESAKAEEGWVEYGLSLDKLDQVARDGRGQNLTDTQHQVTVKGLQPGTVYYYVIVSGRNKYDNAGSLFKVSTNGRGASLQTEPKAQTEGLLVYNRIGIEAGHSDSDPGAMSCDGQHREADNTIAIANLAAGILRQRGYAVDIFRGGDPQMRNYHADVFVALHNDYCAQGAQGFKTSRYGGRAGDGTDGSNDASDRLVQSIWSRYRSVTGMAEDRSPGHFTTNMLRYYALSWIASDTPGAIIEMGWWSGDEDRLLNQRGRLATGVADSVLAFLGRTDGDDNRSIGSGQTLNGTIDPANDEDTYYLDATQGQCATIRMNRTATGLDSYLILFAPNGAEVARDDDSGGNNNAWINRATLPQNGRYRVVAKSWNGRSTGPYSLSLNLESCGSVCTPGANGVVLYEHPNYQGRCITFTGDDTDFGNDNFNDMVSSIRFVGSYASGWEALLYEHSYYGGVASTFRGDDPNLGNDTIGHDRASSIRIRRVETDDGRVLSSGQTLNGTIDPANDEDTYYFDATQGQCATIRMNRTATGLDSYLILFAPNGAEVARDDDSGGNNNAWINRATLPQNGRYRVVAKSWNGRSTGPYSLSLNLESCGSVCTPGANGVVLYEHPNYQGRCITFTGDDTDFGNDNFNDMVSSIRFVGSYASGWEALLYEHSYYGGVASTFRGDDPNLGNDTIGHDRASSIRIRRVTPLSPPTGVSASDGTYTDRVRVTWNASAGATSYKVFRNTSNNSGGATQIGPAVSGTTYDDTGASAGTYWYWVKASNGAGDSALSNGDSGYRGSGWQSESVNWRVNYGDNWNRSGTITKPGATRIRLHFSAIRVEAGYDHLRTDVGNDWSGNYDNVTSSEKSGSSIGLSLTSDGSVIGYFVIDRVDWQGSATGAATRSGSLFGSVPPSNVNLALNRPAYATSIESATYAAPRGNDGNTSTRWSSQASTSLGAQWWWVDLGTQSFDRVIVRWEAAYATQCFVGWSDNGTDYWGYNYANVSSGEKRYDLGARRARYVAIQMTQRAPRMNNYSFFEIEVYSGAWPSLAQDDGTPEIQVLQPSGELELRSLDMLELSPESGDVLPILP